MVTSGSQWLPVVTSGSQWLPVVLNGSQWLPVILNGSQWLPVVLNSSQWFSVVTSGSQWLPGYLHRIVKRRNAYIEYCYAHGHRPVRPNVKTDNTNPCSC